MWLVGAGYWGRRIQESLQCQGVPCAVIDVAQGSSIDHINTLDPVMLATPLQHHYEQCRTLIDRGHDVYVEKPMAATAAEVQDLQQRCSDQQVVMVAHLFQHHPQRSEIQTLIRTGFIGTLQHITSRRLNWGIYQTAVDPVLSLATHDISIIADFAEWPMRVTSVHGWSLSANLQPDRVQFSGLAGSVGFDVDVSWCWPVRTRQTVFIGTEGQIVWDQDTNVYVISRHHIVDHRAVADSQIETVPYNSTLSPLDHTVQHWIQCVQQRRKPTTGFEQALTVATVIDQIHELL